MMDFFPVPDSSEFGTDVQPQRPITPTAPSPSIDPYVSEHDRLIVTNLPEEGKQQFRENVHHYIGQLEKDYPAPKEKTTNMEERIYIIHFDARAVLEAMLEAIRAEESTRHEEGNI